MPKIKKPKFVLRLPERWLKQFRKTKNDTKVSINDQICEKLAKDLRDNDYLKYHN